MEDSHIMIIIGIVVIIVLFAIYIYIMKKFTTKVEIFVDSIGSEYTALKSAATQQFQAIEGDVTCTGCAICKELESMNIKIPACARISCATCGVAPTPAA